MSDDTGLSSRKLDHIRINLDQDVRSSLSTGLERYHFVHQALPQISLVDVDTSQAFLSKQLNIPLLISSMTGGTEEALRINRNLAQAAQARGAAMGVGSQRAAIEHPEWAYTFKVRQYAPDVLLMANLGAVQLNYGYGVDQCLRAVDMIEANALILHLNPLQEALQPEGDTDFAGLLPRIEQVCRALPVPVVVKEVGWGISARTARLLASAGAAAIDVAGAGGTSWSQVEMYRISHPLYAQAAAAFRGWGIPTAESILQVRRAVPEIPIIASGGLRDGIDLAKCLALGARLGGAAGLFLKAAAVSPEKVIESIDLFIHELRICMFAVGAENLSQLDASTLIERLTYE